MDLKIRLTDVFRATLANDCGNVGFVGLAGDGSDYHVVVPVDYQLAKGVKACNRPTDGTPFGGYKGWNYFECSPFAPRVPGDREERTRTNAMLLTAWAAGLGIRVEMI